MVKRKHRATPSQLPQGSRQTRVRASLGVARRMGDQGSEDRKLNVIYWKRWKTSKWVHIGCRLPCHSKAFQKAGTGAKGGFQRFHRKFNVVYSLDAVPVHADLQGIKMIPADHLSGQVSEMSENTWYLTTVEDLTNTLMDLRLREEVCPTLEICKGVLVDSTQASARPKENLSTLLSTGPAPCLIEKSHVVSRSVIRRVLNAQRRGYGHVIIAQAFANRRHLFVQDANMNDFIFCADHHPALRSLTNQQLASFTIDPAGSGLHWADLDLDVDLDGLHAGAAHHETPSSNPELDNHRLATARALELWLEQHPDIPRQLSDEAGKHVSTILSGSADLRTSMIRELARQGSMDPRVVLEQLAELRHVTSCPGSP